MKKFLLKFSVFILFILIFICSLNFLYKHTIYYRQENQVERFRNVPQNIQIANVGNSHGLYSFNYSEHTEYICMNFSFSSQGFYYDLAILEQYKKHIKKNAIIFIPICYVAVYHGKSIGNSKDLRLRYYRFLKPKYILDYSIREYFFYNLFPIFSARENIFHILNDIDKENLDYFNSFDFTITSEEFKKGAAEKYKSWNTPAPGENPEVDKENFIYNIDLVSNIIDFCYENEFIPILICTPITTYLNEEYERNDPDFFEQFYLFFDELQKKYPSILFWDYSHDKNWESDYDYFRDDNHLNKQGSLKFVNEIFNRLKENGLL